MVLEPGFSVTDTNRMLKTKNPFFYLELEYCLVFDRENMKSSRLG